MPCLPAAAIVADIAPALAPLILAAAGFSSFCTVAFIVSYGPHFHNLSGLFATLLLGVSAVFLHAGRVLVALRMIIWGLWLLVAAWGFVIAGIRTPLLFAMPLLVALSGWLLTPRETGLLVAMSVALLTFFAWGEQAGWIQVHVTRDVWAYWFAMESILVFALVVAVSLNRSFSAHHQRVMDLTRELRHLARHDNLTGLLNRVAAMDFLVAALARAERANHLVVVLFIDLDCFKGINDSLGHRAGDQVLIRVAEHLQAAVRVTDAAARLGGDEFIAVLTDLADMAAVEHALQRLRASLTTPVVLDSGQSLEVGASIGLAVSPRDGADAEALIHHADAAMYQAKALASTERAASGEFYQ